MLIRSACPALVLAFTFNIPFPTSTAHAAEEWKPGKAPTLVPLKMFKADPSPEVTVWATSPQLYNPMNMDIDQAGRIWVAEGVNYRGGRVRGRVTGSQCYRTRMETGNATVRTPSCRRKLSSLRWEWRS